MRIRTLGTRFRFEPRDVYIGFRWKFTRTYPSSPVFMFLLDLYVCLIPTLLLETTIKVVFPPAKAKP